MQLRQLDCRLFGELHAWGELHPHLFARTFKDSASVTGSPVHLGVCPLAIGSRGLRLVGRSFFHSSSSRGGGWRCATCQTCITGTGHLITAHAGDLLHFGTLLCQFRHVLFGSSRAPRRKLLATLQNHADSHPTLVELDAGADDLLVLALGELLLASRPLQLLRSSCSRLLQPAKSGPRHILDENPLLRSSPRSTLCMSSLLCLRSVRFSLATNRIHPLRHCSKESLGVVIDYTS
mmetsp:Transcript_43194/g.92423  ORF Transcript_43194/g.92423 Transcript_43194/m.92423 type:complete len:235 (-) Transcript_43194:22-726(-)